MASPLVDTNTLIAIDSLLGRSFGSRFIGRHARDPWAKDLIGTFSDVYIYEDSFRFTVPHPEGESDGIDTDSFAQDVALELKKHDKSTVQAAIISDKDQEVLEKYYSDSTYEEFIHSCLSNFETWVKSSNNRDKLQRWLATQRTKDAQGLWKRQVARKYFFDLDSGHLRNEINTLSEKLKISMDDFCVAFDSVLRVPLYGEKAGSANYYVFHPQREAWRLTIEQKKSSPPNFPISFAFTFSRIASKLTREEYATLLHETRCLIREWNLIKNPPDTHQKPEVLRELAAKLKLPPRLRKSGHAAAIGSAFLALIGGAVQLKEIRELFPDIDALSHYAALASPLVAAGAVFHNRFLPRGLCTFKMVMASNFFRHSTVLLGNACRIDNSTKPYIGLSTAGTLMIMRPPDFTCRSKFFTSRSGCLQTCATQRHRT